MVNIKVAVRIRPLSQRESLLGENTIVRKENNFVLVTYPKIPESQDGDSRQRTRRFAVDFCYDSNQPEGCSQEAVYKEIGSEVLDSMFEGYNACVLAYGHSASGKTYTIMGTQDDLGLTPRLCRGLFDKLNKGYFNEKIRFQVIVSFLEIYNEKVRDLLGSEETLANGSNFSLRVREHPKLGPYVQGLSEHLVTEKRKLFELLATGNRRRSTAATESNSHSSRSHTVFTIQFKLYNGVNFEAEKWSKLHLVDLAGSLQEVSQKETQTDERANSSQSKERLKEGANINKSLVTLGNVISALAETRESNILLKAQPTSKTWHPFAPYRDSVLTWLLKDTLGGNSNTIMIATVSPASSCLCETINTLRYAKRTKRIMNQPVVNEDPKIRTIRQLRQEIARLKRLLLSYQSCGSWSEIEENNIKEAMLFSIPESKWLDPGGTNITTKEVRQSKEEKKQKPFTKDDEQGECEDTSDSEGENDLKDSQVREEQKNFEDFRPSSANDRERSVLGQGAAFSEANACKINDEKKSDVNGSVKDNFSHETQIFSDSLESFSSVFLKSGNASRETQGASGRPRPFKNACETRETPAENVGPYLLRDFSSCEDLTKTKASEMLHRSRPDLIKGISSRSKEGPPSRNGQCFTDVSDLSQSTSENSLYSSGSADILSLGKGQPRNQEAKILMSQGEGEKRKEKGAEDKGDESECLQSAPKKTEKRSEIVEAVTSRLYFTKKKPNRRGLPAKQEVEEDGELEDIKICKRARMKMFDLNRKLAMTRKMKKTVECDTQTDNMTATLRVKEKCVTTDPRGDSGSEQLGTSDEHFDKKKPCLVMNQVFIPQASNYVVECGKVVRIEAPETTSKHESATQTAHEGEPCRNATTSPIKFNFRDEECYSEDSLDLEDKSQNCREMMTEERAEVDPKPKASFCWPPDSEIYFSCNPEKRATENSEAESEKSKEGLLIYYTEETSSESDDFGILLSDTCENSSEEWRREENISSENSFTSVDGMDMSCSSETSSEDFVFYESVKDKDLLPKGKPRGDRELYTITENSEQSDPSDAFSPVQSRAASLNEVRARAPENSLGCWQGGSVQVKPKKNECKCSVNVKWAKIRDKLFESIPASTENETEIKNWAEDSEKIFKVFLQTSNCAKIKSENMNVPKSVSLFTADTDSEIPERMPRFAKDSETENKTEIIHSQTEGFPNRLKGTEAHPKPSNSSNTQKQYLNLSVPRKSITTAPAFSVDTNLFGKASKKDQSSDGGDAMFNSADSITFVFMGPAKPKTSVLMEIIRRSLGKTLSSTDEFPFSQRKSRSRGVQCDVNLMRSVSVDSAITALSRIAKNQEPYSGLRRAASLRALSPNETAAVLSQGKLQRREKNYIRRDVKARNSDGEKKKSALKYSLSRSSNSVEKMKNDIEEEAEKAKKSVSWSGETKHEVELEWEEPDFDVKSRDSLDAEADDSHEGLSSKFSPQKRVRFLNRKSQNIAKIDSNPGQTIEPVRHGDSLKDFLKEATQLLKYINFCSSKYPEFSREAVANEGNQMAEEIHSINGLNNSRNPDSTMGRSIKGNYRSSENASRRVRTDASGWETKEGHLTWPRMRSIVGKTGIEPKYPVSFLPSATDSLQLNGLTDSTKSFSRSSPTGSWKLSNLSAAPRNIQSRSSGCQPCCCWNESSKFECIDEPFSLPPAACFRSNASSLNLVPLTELETNIEESCRRLETATERDRMRESISVGEKMSSDRLRNEDIFSFKIDAEDEFKEGKMQSRELIKRRKPDQCAGNCTCKTSLSNDIPCKHLWSKGCRSNFELDSFGPGSMHCPQLCMFCRKKDAEMYYSAINLNSKCSSDLCRLNCYGFCPCSSVRLNHVTSSPRAYMQRLLALRRRIVNRSERKQFDKETWQPHSDEGNHSLGFF